MIFFSNEILIYSKSKEEYVGHLQIVGYLKDKQLYCKFLKYEFLMYLLAFLRHVVFEKGIMADPY